MDIFVRQIPQAATDRLLNDFFRPHLAEHGIHVYDCQKLGQKALAKITVLDTSQATLFLAKNAGRLVWVMKDRVYNIVCSASRDPPTDLSLRSLVLKAAKRSRNPTAAPPELQPPNKQNSTFRIATISCGTWDYVDGNLVLVPYYEYHRAGTLLFGSKQAAILLPAFGALPPCRIDITYYDVDTVVTGSYDKPTITFSLSLAPKFYHLRESTDMMQELLAQFNLGSNASTPGQMAAAKKIRVTGIDDRHTAVAGQCFVYQVRLDLFQDIQRVHALVRHIRALGSTMSYPTGRYAPTETLQMSFGRLSHQLTDQQLYGTIRLLYRELPIAGPHTEAHNFSNSTLTRLLSEHAADYDHRAGENPYELASRFSHLVLVHKLTVTPAGTYLEGPSAEVTNRVLRRYPSRHDYFLRVTFSDEDGESIRYDSHSSNEQIFRSRFQKFIDGSFLIADRGFSFLGFSHSSLRTQSCWFMSPFIHQEQTGERGMMYAPLVIKRLGDFSSIRSPPKCAARIGQAFTDTTGTVSIPAPNVRILPEVERNGRVFSDGVGTISERLIEKIWRVYGRKHVMKPTILQIRFAGKQQ
ncbi:hypothetical protein M8818_005823 [Zalaria obscura]|uniref:Uncharacterized protein n=1 Tax=Zalaria obscura TaxID=2024903 RepID=A0ACC3S7P5_9PEZI